jgi:hypothetical protein
LRFGVSWVGDLGAGGSIGATCFSIGVWIWVVAGEGFVVRYLLRCSCWLN